LDRLLALLVVGSIVGLIEAPLARSQVDSAASVARIEAEHRCVDQVRAEIARFVGLLDGAKRQLAGAQSVAARAEAAESVAVLEARLREAASSLLACLPPAPVEAATEARAVEPQAPVFAPIGANLRADAPTFAGHARVPAEAIHRALVPFGAGFDACYDALADRHAIVRGSVALRLEVRADGSVASRQLLRFEIGDEPFRRCVHAALARIASPGRPSGGAATVDVMLMIGPEG